MGKPGVTGLDGTSVLDKAGTQGQQTPVVWSPLGSGQNSGATSPGGVAIQTVSAAADALPLVVKGLFSPSSGPDDAELRRVALVGSFWIDTYCKLTGYKAGSPLSGAMLRMYLARKIDPEVIKKAGQEIAASQTFKDLAGVIQDALQEYVAILLKDKRPWPTDEALRKFAEDYLVDLRQRNGIAFRGPLNAVIGGITGIRAPSIQVTKRVLSPKRSTEYRLAVTFTDTYDFENDRSGNPKYDLFRKGLAGLLIGGKRWDFAVSYNGALTAGYPVARNMIFASYMYAVERAGITGPGIEWSTTIPAAGKITEP